jgi:Tol biopolymer transport system component
MLFPYGITPNGIIDVLGSSSDKSKLAYVERDERQQRLVIFNFHARQAVTITEWPKDSLNRETEYHFAWAFDNEHFLFSSGYPGQHALYIGNSYQLIGQPIPLTEEHVAFAWSPTKLQFAYFSSSKLIIQNLQGQTLPIQIGHQAGLPDTSLSWSPDGTQLAISVRRGASFDIFMLSFSDNAPVLQTLVASPSDDLQASWSPDGRYIAFYVRSEQYDTKVAISPIDRSRNPYVVGHNASLPPEGGPRWLSDSEVIYIGEEQLSATHNSVHRVDIKTGHRSSIPITLLLSQ